MTATKSPPWVKADLPWSDYPPGTKAKAIIGSDWVRTKTGWRKGRAGVKRKPDGTCIGIVQLPASK